MRPFYTQRHIYTNLSLMKNTERMNKTKENTKKPINNDIDHDLENLGLLINQLNLTLCIALQLFQTSFTKKKKKIDNFFPFKFYSIISLCFFKRICKYFSVNI